MTIRSDRRRLRAAEHRRQLAMRTPDEIRELMIRAIVESVVARGTVTDRDLILAEIPRAMITSDFKSCLEAAKRRHPKLTNLTKVMP